MDEKLEHKYLNETKTKRKNQENKPQNYNKRFPVYIFSIF